MRILIRQFLGKAHSWSVCGWGMATALKDLGHSVDLFSTDGIENLPSSLKENLIGYVEEHQNTVFGKIPNSNYDCQISYTAMKNFPHYLSSGDKNRFGIWCYEWAGKNVLPTGFAKHYKSCDYLCAPSNFAKKVFIDSGIPETNIKVIPHGINAKDYQQINTIKFQTNKTFKIGSVIGQNHLRKNIPGLLEAYGKAFSNKDDVCLILKAKDKPINHPFEMSLKNCLKEFYVKYPQHAEIKLFSEHIPDMSVFYRSIDVIYSLFNCEGFYFPALEAVASGKLSIAPNNGGHLDFANSDNSLLIEGKEVRADPKSMYWESKPNAIWFQPSIDDAIEKLRLAHNNYEKLNNEINNQKQFIHNKYDWKVIMSQFLDLCK